MNHPHPDPLDPIHKEILSHCRRIQASLRGADLSDLPSAAELLTIAQFGFPRTYHLNDGMGLE